jgi:serine protein kinase
MKSIVAEVASDSSRPFLSPLAVFDALEKLLRDKSVYDFLRLEPDEGYHDCEYFIEEVRGEYSRWVAVEVYDSMGLIEETEYDRRVEDYFRHVRAYVAGEKVQNARTGQYEDASEDVMHGLEKLMTLRESPDAFRKNLLAKIAAYSLEHPNTKIDYHEIFSELFHNLRDSYYKEKAKQLVQLGQYVLMHESDDKNLIPAYELPKVENTLKVMREKYGYNNDSAREAINLVLRSVQEKS